MANERGVGRLTVGPSTKHQSTVDKEEQSDKTTTTKKTQKIRPTPKSARAMHGVPHTNARLVPTSHVAGKVSLYLINIQLLSNLLLSTFDF